MSVKFCNYLIKLSTLSNCQSSHHHMSTSQPADWNISNTPQTHINSVFSHPTNISNYISHKYRIKSLMTSISLSNLVYEGKILIENISDRIAQVLISQRLPTSPVPSLSPPPKLLWNSPATWRPTGVRCFNGWSDLTQKPHWKKFNTSFVLTRCELNLSLWCASYEDREQFEWWGFIEVFFIFVSIC